MSRGLYAVRHSSRGLNLGPHPQQRPVRGPTAIFGSPATPLPPTHTPGYGSPSSSDTQGMRSLFYHLGCIRGVLHLSHGARQHVVQHSGPPAARAAHKKVGADIRHCPRFSPLASYTSLPFSATWTLGPACMLTQKPWARREQPACVLGGEMVRLTLLTAARRIRVRKPGAYCLQREVGRKKERIISLCVIGFVGKKLVFVFICPTLQLSGKDLCTCEEVLARI